MNLTEEQQLIVESNENLKVNAAAGSGKSHSLLAYAESKQSRGSILYLAYNKNIQEEIQKKAKARSINMTVLTTHSLAYRELGKLGYKITLGFFTYGIFKEVCQVRFGLRKEGLYALFKKTENILNLWSCLGFNMNELLDRHQIYGNERDCINYVFQEMCNFRLPVSHDFYLKMFSRMNIQLGYDYILVDEAQDQVFASLHFVSNQNNTIKIFIGDENQSIYSFRFATNALGNPLLDDYRPLYLTQSFRYTQRIANIANEVLSWKEKYSDYQHVPIRGLENAITVPNRAVITRTNFTLLNQAYITANQGRDLFIEGKLNLENYHKTICDFNRIRLGQKPILPYLKNNTKSLSELKSTYAVAEDFEMLNLVKLVETFRNDSPNIIPKIQSRLVAKENSDIVLTNTHKSKGLEYNEVILADDFISYEGITEENAEKMNLDEEINLLYVALTRTTNSLILPYSTNKMRLQKLGLL